MKGPLVTYLGNDEWELEAEFTFKDITVPEGFHFDLASIPRPLWNIIAPFELSVTAPLVHDYLYRHGGKVPGTEHVYTRAETDYMFNAIMELEGVPTWRRVLGYNAVRMFGGRAWKG
jgi:uncharacterized protein DUF1353